MCSLIGVGVVLGMLFLCVCGLIGVQDSPRLDGGMCIRGRGGDMNDDE